MEEEQLTPLSSDEIRRMVQQQIEVAQKAQSQRTYGSDGYTSEPDFMVPFDFDNCA